MIWFKIKKTYVERLSKNPVSKKIQEPSTRRMADSNKDEKFEKFASVLIGNYSSKKQREADTTYLNISLKISSIWPEKKEGIWVYVEQALASMQDNN